MTWVPTFHSISDEDREVYHNNGECDDGRRIKAENRRSGDAGRPLCDRCKELNAQGR